MSCLFFFTVNIVRCSGVLRKKKRKFIPKPGMVYVLLSNHQIFYCSTIFVPPFHHQMFHSTIMIVPLFHRQMFCSSTIRCSTVPTTDVLLFHHQMFHFSTISVPPSDVPLLTISVFCSTIRSSTVPPFLFHFSTTSCSTISVSLFHHQMFYCSTIRCSTVQPSDILLFQHEIIHSFIMIV